MAERRFALIIANGDYDLQKGGYSPLKAPLEDAVRMEAVLGDPGIGGFEVTPLINPDRSGMEDALFNFFSQERQQDDLLLFYYSGHGEFQSASRLYFAVRNSDQKKLPISAVSSSFLEERIAACPARRKVLLLDCCFSGSFGRGASPKSSLALEAIFKDSRGTFVLTASGALEWAHELKKEKEECPLSVFTRVLEDGLRSGAADLGDDGKVSFDDLCKYVEAEVPRLKPGQNPTHKIFDAYGEVVVAYNPAAAHRIPKTIQENLQSGFQEIREGAVRWLHKAAQSGEPYAAAARREWERLLEEDDPQVREVLKGVNRAAEPEAQPPAAPPPSVRSPVSIKNPPVAPKSEIETLLDRLQRVDLDPKQRAEAGDRLWALGWEPEDLYRFAPIPDAQQPRFWIGFHPVTNAQYQRFLTEENFYRRDYWSDLPCYGLDGEALAGQKADGWGWLKEKMKDGILEPRHWKDPVFGIARRGAPVVGISWYEANAYCRWLRERWAHLEEGRRNPGVTPAAVRLPLIREWELAAGGSDPRERCPWWAAGRKDPAEEMEILQRANVAKSVGHTTSAGSYPAGRSQPHGLWDLAGNAWEWQANFYDKDHDVLALRGGSWYLGMENVRVAGRGYSLPVNLFHNHIGFRVLVSPG